MKTKSKALLLTLCAVLLVAASVLGTMAYLTSQDSVTNTFTVGNVAITLDETEVNLNGEAAEGAARVKANKYKLMPGHTYTKDPTVHVTAGSEDCYIFVKVENGISDFEVARGNANTIDEQMLALGWTNLTSSDGTSVYYKTYTKDSPSNDFVVFNYFKIAGNANEKNGWGDITDATVVVKAYAVQKDGFETAEDAWTASGFAAG